MYNFFLISVSVAFAACTTQSNELVNSSNETFENKYSTISAAKTIEIAKILSVSDTVSEYEWHELFESSGYKNYLVYSDSTKKRELIKNALITVFDPKNKEILDSLLKKPIQMDANFMMLSLIQNINDLKQNLPQAEAFLEQTDIPFLLKSADSLAKTYLPNSIHDSLPKLYDVHFVISDPDGKVLNNSIVVDLNLATQMGKEGLMVPQKTGQ